MNKTTTNTKLRGEPYRRYVSRYEPKWWERAHTMMTRQFWRLQRFQRKRRFVKDGIQPQAFMCNGSPPVRRALSWMDYRMRQQILPE